MTEEWTCGMGLAAHAPLPTKLGELTAAVADTLATHMQALDRSDGLAQQEYAAYEQLAQAHRQIAALLLATAEQMAGCRDLPMGRHDLQAMASPRALAAFADFVERERELVALLQERLAQDEGLLALMQGGAAGDRG